MNASTSVFLSLVSLSVIAVTLGRMCYQTMPEGQEAIISCNGSCVVKITQDRKMYKCSDDTHQEGCFHYSQGQICYCNYDLCLRMLDTISFFRFYPVLNNPVTEQLMYQQQQPTRQQQQWTFQQYLKIPVLDQQKRRQNNDLYIN